MKTGAAEIFEEPFQLEGGTKIFLLSYKIPLQEDNNVIGLFGISIDVTKSNFSIEKIKTERDAYFFALDSIIASLPGHVYWQDRNNVFLGCNELHAKSAGLKSRFEIIGKSNYDLPWKEQAEILNNINNEVMETGKEYSLEESGELWNGTQAVFLSKKVPVRNKNGEIIGIAGIAMDITQRKQAEEQLLAAMKKAESASRAKTEFLQNMRHDFRTPFSGILGMASILYENETDNEKKEQLNSIISSSQALLDQLNEITNFISIESGELAVIEKQFDLYKVLADLKNMLLSSVQEKKLQLIVEIDEEIPKFILGDVMRTQRILMNILTNAVKFTNAGHVLMQASLAKQEENDRVIIKFKIEDTGIGISKEEQDFIFERFSRLSPSYRGIYPGKGFGLKIVKQFLDELGGEVHMTSKPHNGTTFIILIPYKLPLLRCDEKKLLSTDSVNFIRVN
jgi:PAS domain S-box-containing protein